MLKYFDLLSIEPKLYVNNSSKLKTNLGAMFTFLTAVLSIAAFVAFGIDLVERKKPQTNTSKEFLLSPKMSLDNMLVYLGVLGPQGVPIEDFDRKFYLKVVYMKIDVNKIDYTYHDMVKCKETKEYKENYLNLTHEFRPEATDNFYCLPPQVRSQIPLVGTEGASTYSSVQFVLYKCKNGTNFQGEENNNTCLPASEIQKDMQNFNIRFGFVDYYVKFDDYENPVKHYFNTLLIKSSLALTSFDVISFKVMDFISDYGWMFEDEQRNQYYQSAERLVQYVNNQKLPYTNVITLNLKNLKEIYIRRYVKIQAVLANIGGMIKIILMILSLVNKYFSEFDYFTAIFTQLEGIENFDNIRNNAFTNNAHDKSELMPLPPRVPLKRPDKDYKKETIIQYSQNKKEIVVNTEGVNRSSLVKSFSFFQKLIIIVCKFAMPENLKSQNRDYSVFKAKVEKYLDIVKIIKFAHLMELKQNKKAQNERDDVIQIKPLKSILHNLNINNCANAN